ncbi:hypothetical protein BC832DRAFT_562216 [Gaertneriomyces semiglobifer]|nr:hypothetical protein BC832DRAFT_562216 [Gaertneriomyces semiglobifer]
MAPAHLSSSMSCSSVTVLSQRDCEESYRGWILRIQALVAFGHAQMASIRPARVCLLRFLEKLFLTDAARNAQREQHLTPSC